MNTKIEPNLDGSIKNNVARVPQQEHYDKKILQQLTNKCNIYYKLVLLLKLDTQTHYNIRIILGLEKL